MRVFPISNWTELDVWSYIKEEDIPIPSIYFAHKRKVFLRDGLIWSHSDYVYQEEDEEVLERMVRFRTVGDMSCTAAVFSEATDIDAVVQEIRESTISERGARIDDKRSEAAMEKENNKGISSISEKKTTIQLRYYGSTENSDRRQCGRR